MRRAWIEGLSWSVTAVVPLKPVCSRSTMPPEASPVVKLMFVWLVLKMFE